MCKSNKHRNWLVGSATHHRQLRHQASAELAKSNSNIPPSSAWFPSLRPFCVICEKHQQGSGSSGSRGQFWEQMVCGSGTQSGEKGCNIRMEMANNDDCVKCIFYCLFYFGLWKYQNQYQEFSALRFCRKMYTLLMRLIKMRKTMLTRWISPTFPQQRLVMPTRILNLTLGVCVCLCFPQYFSRAFENGPPWARTGQSPSLKRVNPFSRSSPVAARNGKVHRKCVNQWRGWLY